MTRDELLVLTRTILDDETPDFKISDARLVFWLSEGQDKFCQKTGFFTDKATYNVTTVAEVDDYAMNSRIIEIKEIMSPDGTRLTRFQASDLFPTTVTSAETATHWQTDEATGRVRLYPTPSISGSVYTLRVWRMPKISLTHQDADGNYDVEPELRDDLVGACAEYAAFKALSIHDMEVEDAPKAPKHLAMFNSYVTDGKIAFARLSGAQQQVSPAAEYIV